MKKYTVELNHIRRERVEIEAASILEAEEIGREMAARADEFCDPCEGEAVGLGRVVEISENEIDQEAGE